MTTLKKSMLAVFSILFVGNLVNARDLLATTCTNPSSGALTSCSVGFNSCNKCIGQTDCCGIVGNTAYGICKDSNAHDCPDGSRFICNGGNCPSGIVCNYVNPQCQDPRHCWGTISCIGNCPSGYYNGMFCHEDGSSNNFKVCCSYGGVATDCQVSSWGTWGSCNSTTGLKTQTRTITQQALYGGAVCPSLSQTAPCDPVDCQVSSWGTWGSCNSATGLKTHTRTITQHPVYGGAACLSLSETAPCDPIDCQVSSWGTWGSCDSVTGLKTHTRTITQQPVYGGSACPYLSETIACEPVNCQVSEWGPLGVCVNGQQTQTRTIIQQSLYGGFACPYLTQSVSCGSGLDCQVSSWETWGSCDSTTGLKTHTRTVTQQPQNGGAACPYLSETIACDPVNCQVSGWGPLGACINGLQTQTRTVIQQPLYGGTACPYLTQSVYCLLPTTGCGADLLVYKCTLSNSNGVGTTNCPSPGGELVVVVPNKKGWKFANVRVNGKAVSYTQS
jgi:hypothetical protein